MENKKASVASETANVLADRAMEEDLRAEKTAIVFIVPEDDSNKEFKGSINGVDFCVPTGRQVEVSIPIAKVIENYQRQKRMNRAKDDANKSRYAEVR